MEVEGCIEGVAMFHLIFSHSISVIQLRASVLQSTGGSREGCNLIPFGPTMNNDACCVIFSSCTHCSYYTLKPLASRALPDHPVGGLEYSPYPLAGWGATLSLGGGGGGGGPPFLLFSDAIELKCTTLTYHHQT